MVVVVVEFSNSPLFGLLDEYSCRHAEDIHCLDGWISRDGVGDGDGVYM